MHAFRFGKGECIDRYHDRLRHYDSWFHRLLGADGWTFDIDDHCVPIEVGDWIVEDEDGRLSVWPDEAFRKNFTAV